MLSSRWSVRRMPLSLVLLPLLLAVAHAEGELTGGLVERLSVTPARSGLPCPAPVDGLCLTLAPEGRLVAYDRLTGASAELGVFLSPSPQGRPAAPVLLGNKLALAGPEPGIHVLELLQPDLGGRPGLDDLAPIAAAFIPLPRPMESAAASEQAFYMVLAGGDLLALPLPLPSPPVPRLLTTLKSMPHAMAAGSRRLYLLDADGLSILQLDSADAAPIVHDPAVRGEALRLEGRLLHVYNRHRPVRTFVDTAAEPQEIRVAVNNNFFAPENVTLFPGDRVTWRNLSGFYNVLACDDFGFGCERGPATEFFTSGDVQGPPWIYSYTFTRNGFNPYKCVPHTPFMVGTVTVTDRPPPALPGTVDIKPGSCRNPVRAGARGVLPAAVAGGPERDVRRILPETVRLAGVPALRWSVDDVTSEAPGGEEMDCASPCRLDGPDGIPDLTLKFDQQAVLNAAGPLINGQCLTLDMTWRVDDANGGTAFRGTDVLVVTGHDRR